MKERREKIKSIVMKLRPILVLIILIPLVAFMFYPMANMTPRDLHVGIVNLDTGAEFEHGKVNIGSKIIDKITDTDADNSDEDADESPVIWQEYDSRQEARDAMSSGDIYAYLIIPRDFSQSQTSTMDALNTLGNALGTMSTGLGQMSTGIGKMSSNLTKLPSAFGKLSDATGQMSTGAQNLSNVSGMVNNESGNITTAAETISSNTQTQNEALSTAKSDMDDVDMSAIEDELAKVEAAVEAGETPDLTALQNAINSTKTSVNAASQSLNQAASVDNSQALSTINQNAGMIGTQSANMSTGLDGIATGTAAMSSNFSQMSSKMSNVGPGISKMQTAISTLSEGLGTMSDNLDEKVSDAIDTMNSTDSDSSDTEDSSQTATLQFYVDQSCNVLVSTTLGSMINGVSANTGMKVETTYINELPDGTDTMYFLMAFLMLGMFSSMVPAIITGLTTRSDRLAPMGRRVASLAVQLAICACAAALIGCIVPRVACWMCGYDPGTFSNLTPFMAIFSLGIMVMTVGAFDLVGIPAVIIPMGTMFCGTAVASLPYEYLPSFWQHYIYPWEPLRLLTEGLREIVYRDNTWWNHCAQALLWMTVIGIIFMLLSLLKGLRRPKMDTAQTDEDMQDAVLQ